LKNKTLRTWIYEIQYDSFQRLPQAVWEVIFHRTGKETAG